MALVGVCWSDTDHRPSQYTPAQIAYATAHALHLEGDLKSAEREYRRAMQLDETYFYPVHNLGVLLAGQSGREKEAESLLRRSINLQPRADYARVDLANLLARIGDRSAEARTNYWEALRINPNNFYARLGLGMLSYREGAYAQAEEELRKAVLVADRAICHYNLALVLYDRDKIQDAEKHFRRAIELDPCHFFALYNLGVVLAEQKGREEEAGKFLEKAIAAKPSDPLPYAALADLLARTTPNQHAVDLLVKAIELKPNFPQAYDTLGDGKTLHPLAGKA